MFTEGLKVEITREEYDDFRRYEAFYTCFNNEKKDSLVSLFGVYKNSTGGINPYNEVFYCTEALDLIESFELERLKASNDYLRKEVKRLEDFIDN